VGYARMDRSKVFVVGGEAVLGSRPNYPAVSCQEHQHPAAPHLRFSMTHATDGDVPVDSAARQNDVCR